MKGILLDIEGTTTVSGSLGSKPNSLYTIDFYATDVSEATILECFRRGTEPQEVTVVVAQAPPPQENSDGGENPAAVVSSPTTVAHSADDGF